MVTIAVDGADYDVPSSAADTNWAPAQVAFEQALATAVNDALDQDDKTFNDATLTGVTSIDAVQLGGAVVDPGDGTATIPCGTYGLIDFNAPLAGDVALTGTPSISNGVEGQQLILTNLNATHKMTISDNATVAGSGVHLSATSIDFKKGSSVTLIYLSGDWYQIGTTQIV